MNLNLMSSEFEQKLEKYAKVILKVGLNLAKEDILERLMKNYELEAVIYDAFGGVLDFSEELKLGKVGKLTLKAAATKFCEKVYIQ